jgi:hypothetical protein
MNGKGSKLVLSDVREMRGIEDHRLVRDVGSLEDVKARAAEARRHLAELEDELDAAFELDVGDAARGKPMKNVAAVRRATAEAEEEVAVLDRAIEAAKLARREAIAEAQCEVLEVLRAEAGGPIRELYEMLRRANAGPNRRLVELWRIGQRLGAQFAHLHWAELMPTEETGGHGSRIDAWANYCRELGLFDG